MSRVHAAGKRGPGVVRAAVGVGLSFVLWGSCSAAAIDASQNGAASYRLASATPADLPEGYLQISRVDLAPVDELPSKSSGVKTADGYGPYGPAPMSDGTFAGPRVYSPYDQPNGGYAPPPPPPPPSGGYAPPQPPQSYYAPPPAPAPAPGPGGPYGYGQQSQNQQTPQNGGGYNAAPQGYAYYGPDQRYGAPAGRRHGREPAPAVADASHGRMVRLETGETLLSLSQRYGVSVASIARANGLRGGPIMPGTPLFIPSAEPSKLAQAPARQRAKVAECTGANCYTVQRGETIAVIARTHGVSEQQLLEANNLTDARALRAGQSIAIPGGEAQPRQAMASSTPQNRQTPHPAGRVSASAEAAPDGTLQEAEQAKSATPVKTTAVKQPEPSCEAALANPLPRMGKSFRKPVEGYIIGQFGPQRDGTVNEGLTISVPKGTPIKAAENGVVAYVGDELPGFGNLILIRHAEEYVTAYAHADEISVKKCDIVKRGQIIGTAGATGDASQPQLHFEIRKNAKPVDPTPLLGS